MKSHSRTLAVAVAAAAGVWGSASGATILTLENPGSAQFQQTLNNPCVIGDPSCNQPAGFGESIIPSGAGTYDVTSPIYTVQQILAALGGQATFKVGIDVNTTTSPLATERLDLFTMSVNGVVQAIYDPASPGTQLVTVNNGNGFSDEILTGFNVTGFLGTDQVTFHTIVNTQTDGREEFFLIRTDPDPVPEPASLALLGAGMVGLVAARRRRTASGGVTA